MVFLTQCVSLFVDKRVVLSLLVHNLTFSCPRFEGDNPVRDCITYEIKVYAYNNNNNNNINNNNNNNNLELQITRETFWQRVWSNESYC